MKTFLTLFLMAFSAIAAVPPPFVPSFYNTNTTAAIDARVTSLISGGSATNAIGLVKSNNATAVTGTTTLEFTNGPGNLIFSVTAVGTTAKVSGVLNSITNNWLKTNGGIGMANTFVTPTLIGGDATNIHLQTGFSLNGSNAAIPLMISNNATEGSFSLCYVQSNVVHWRQEISSIAWRLSNSVMGYMPIEIGLGGNFYYNYPDGSHIFTASPPANTLDFTENNLLLMPETAFLAVARPYSDFGYDLGTSSKRWGLILASNVYAANTITGANVTATWGNYRATTNTVHGRFIQAIGSTLPALTITDTNGNPVLWVHTNSGGGYVLRFGTNTQGQLSISNNAVVTNTAFTSGGNAPSIYLGPGGNVGIGTNAPGVPLDVQGAANISGTISGSGTITGRTVQASLMKPLLATASRVMMVDANGGLTNVNSATPSTTYLHPDGTEGTPAGGGSGGTNYPPVIPIGTNVTVGSGVRQRLSIFTNASFKLVFTGTPLNGEFVSVGVSNTSSSIIYVTNTAFNVAVASNDTVWPVAATSIRWFDFLSETNLSTGSQRWEMIGGSQKEMEIAAGVGVVLVTNAANSLITVHVAAGTSNLLGLASTTYTNVPLGGSNINVRTIGGTNFIDTTGQLNNWAKIDTNSISILNSNVTLQGTTLAFGPNTNAGFVVSASSTTSPGMLTWQKSTNGTLGPGFITINLTNGYVGVGVQTLPWIPTNALDVSGSASIWNDLYLPGIASNSAPVNLIGQIAGGPLIKVHLASNAVVVAAGSGVTVTPSGSSGVMTYTVASAAVTSSMTQTNFVLNQVYTNANSTPIHVNATTFLTAAAVNGVCSVDLMWSPSGGTGWAKLAGVGTSTLLTGIAMTETNVVVGVITNTGSYYFTNSSSGAGNAAGLVAGSGQITVLGGGAQGATGASAPTITNTVLNVLGSGGGSTNYVFTCYTNSCNDFVIGSSNVLIASISGGVAGVNIPFSITITNLSGSVWGCNVSAGTNRWLWSGPYGTNAPITLTNNTRYLLAGVLNGSNAVMGWATYNPAQ